MRARLPHMQYYLRIFLANPQDPTEVEQRPISRIPKLSELLGSLVIELRPGVMLRAPPPAGSEEDDSDELFRHTSPAGRTERAPDDRQRQLALPR